MHCPSFSFSFPLVTCVLRETSGEISRLIEYEGGGAGIGVGVRLWRSPRYGALEILSVSSMWRSAEESFDPGPCGR